MTVVQLSIYVYDIAYSIQLRSGVALYVIEILVEIECSGGQETQK